MKINKHKKSGVPYMPSYGVALHVKIENCPICGKEEAMTCDYTGKKLCGKCYLKTL